MDEEKYVIDSELIKEVIEMLSGAYNPWLIRNIITTDHLIRDKNMVVIETMRLQEFASDLSKGQVSDRDIQELCKDTSSQMISRLTYIFTSYIFLQFAKNEKLVVPYKILDNVVCSIREGFVPVLYESQETWESLMRFLNYTRDLFKTAYQHLF